MYLTSVEGYCSLCRTKFVFVVFDRKSNIVCRSMQSKHVVVERVDKVEIV